MCRRLYKPALFALAGCYLWGFLYVAWWSSTRHPTDQYAASKSTKSHKDHPAHSTFGDWITNDAAGFFTFWLVIVGIGQAGLFVWQLRYMRKSLTDAQLLAEAAKASADTAKEQVAITKMGIIDLERAYLAVGPSFMQTRYKVPATRGFSVPTDPKEITVFLSVTNTGRTSATIRKIYGEFSRTPPRGDRATYINGSGIETDLALLAGASEVLKPFEFKDDFSGPQFFWGYVEYKDIFKIVRVARFCSYIVPDDYPGVGKMQLAGSEGWRECD